MIIDIHTHTPTHRKAVPDEEMRFNTTWRPGTVVPITVSWKDFLDAMESVDKVCVFGIQEADGEDVNLETAAFVEFKAQ